MHIEEILIKLNVLPEKYHEILKKVSNVIKKELNSKPVYNKKHLRTKIKSFNGKINKNYQNNKIPKGGSQCICLSAISVDSVYRKEQTIILKCF